MSNKIVSFEEFSKKAHGLMGEDTVLPVEDGDEMPGASSDKHGEQHYMFFQNLASIKHYIEEILVLNPAEIDELLKNGHDWASDHIATSKDDIQEVAEWLRNELSSESDHGETEEKPENITVDVEGDDDKVEVEGGDEEEEEEDNKEEDEDEE